MYTVVHDNEEITCTSRREAIQRARKLSSHARSPVRVVRDNGIERMVYRNGALQEAAYLTRDRRRSGSVLR